MPEPKKTQLDRMQPHSAGPAELSVPEPVVEVSDQHTIMMLSGLHARTEMCLSVPTSSPSPSHSCYSSICPAQCTGSIMQVLWLCYC